MNTSEKISVNLGNRSYDVLVASGLLTAAADHISPFLNRPRVVIVTDETVARLYLDPLADNLCAAGITVDQLVLPAGEKTKSFNHLENLCEELLRLQVERDDIVISMGGGVIGDLAGFASAILRRGCRFIQIPTTLLAQVDSSVGGKTAINTKHGKNLVGAFHQPALVLADVGVLNTLPPRELRAGYGEVVKYGLLGDADFFGWLEQHGAKLLAGNAAYRVEAVKRSVEAKAGIVAQDERENGIRALLNLGHTFGHALEAHVGFSGKLLHGEGVALGIVLAFELSAQQKFCNSQDTQRVKKHFADVGLPVSIQDIDGFAATADDLMSHIYQDKKVSGGKLTFILARGIGEAFVAKNIPPARVSEFLKSNL